MLKMVVLLSFFFIDCSNNITDSESEPGRRDYIWTVDTLDIYYPAYKIWGSSPSDVWAINRSDFNKSIWHFNGTHWFTDSIFRFIQPHALWGFAQNDVYIGGRPNGQIWKFDGQNWSKFAELSKAGTDFIAFENIWGESPDDFYAVGNGPDENLYANHSVITHFKNNKWTFFNTDELIGNVVHLYKNKPDDKIYFKLIKIGGTEHVDSTIIYEYKSGKYIKLYSSLETKGKQADISLIDNEVYFILGNEIAKRKNDNFQTLLEIKNSNFYHRIWGRNSKDIFLFMTNGLAHYNGDNIQYLFYFSYANNTPWTQIYDAAIFDEEVFFTIYEPPTNLKLIYHGKLKE